MQELPPDNVKYAMEHEVRDIVPQDEAWCRQPWVAQDIVQHVNAPLAESARRGHEMVVSQGIAQLGSPVDYRNLITSIDDMTAGLHRCGGISREACDDVGHTHVCRGVVHIHGHTPIPMLFTIKGDNIAGLRAEQD